MNILRLLNYAALPILLVATWLGLYWPWGVLFLWWLVPSVASGQAFLVDDISRNDDPILFWAVATLWALFGALMIAADIFPHYAPWLV